MSHKQAKRIRNALRDDVRGFLGRVALSLQRQFRERVGADLERFPNMARPCHTCAINPSTNDWQGADTTTLRLAAALESANPFYCHDGAPFDEVRGWAVDPKTAPLCAAFAVLLRDPHCVHRAIAEAWGEPESYQHPAIARAAGKLLDIARMGDREGYESEPGSTLKYAGDTFAIEELVD